MLSRRIWWLSNLWDSILIACRIVPICRCVHRWNDDVLLINYKTKKFNSAEVVFATVSETAKRSELLLNNNPYLWHTNNNWYWGGGKEIIVVICFQSVSLTYQQQLEWVVLSVSTCCDLLSIRIFDIPTTTHPVNNWTAFMLWFAFNPYLWHTNNNPTWSTLMPATVVICFQSVSLTYQQQLWPLT